MALVARAERDDGCAVVIKRVRPPFCFDPSFLRLFADEGAVHASLEHENIVRLLDKGEDAGGPYLVFEHVDGTDLGAVMEAQAREQTSSGGLEVEAVVALALPLFRALAAAHEAMDASGAPLHVVHRDVSPGNVLLSVDGDVKLADFGVASFALKTEATVAGELKGKFAYMAPEQTRGERVGPRADLFSAGIVIWEALAGQRLFDGPTDADVVAAVRGQGAADLLTLRPTLPASLAALVAELLDKEPDKRPSNARAVVTRLEDIALELGLDEGLRRHVARLARLAPRTARPLDADLRRRTQRVLGAEGQRPERPRRRALAPLWGAGALVAVLTSAVAFSLVSVGSGDAEIEQLPEEPAPRPPPSVPPTQPASPSSEAATSTPSPVSPPTRVAERDGPPMPASRAGAPLGGNPRVAVGAGPNLPTSAARTGMRGRAPAADAGGSPAAPGGPAGPESPPAGGFGQVSITSEPWASVAVDGTAVARETPVKGLSLPAGRHEVVLSNPVFGTRAFTVEVRPGVESKFFFDLSR